MFRKIDFMTWMDEFFQKKSNELQYSQTMSPKRMQKVTYDLSTAPTRPVLLAVPFSTLIVSRIYSTATPATDKSGSIKVMFDSDDDANVQNAIALFPNDSLRLGVLARQAFFTWTAQADTSIDLYVFPDIEVIAGTTKTQIVGTVTTVNTTADKYPAPSTTVIVESQNASAAEEYTVPAGKYAFVSGMAYAVTGYGLVEIAVDGADYINAAFGVDNSKVANSFNRWRVPAGAKIKASSADVSSSAQAIIEVYDL